MNQKTLLCCVALASLILASCDDGTYEANLKKYIDSAGKQADLESTLFGNVTFVTGTGMGVKVPQLFAGATSKDVTSSSVGHPPLCKIPGLTFTYQMVPAEGEKLPVYLYMGAVAKEDKKASAVMDGILGEVKAHVSGALFRKETIEQHEFHHLRVKSKQTFDGSGHGGTKADVDGQFDLYLYSSASHHILIGWRVPNSLASGLNFQRAVQLSMASFGSAQ